LIDSLIDSDDNSAVPPHSTPTDDDDQTKLFTVLSRCFLRYNLHIEMYR